MQLTTLFSRLKTTGLEPEWQADEAAEDLKENITIDHLAHDSREVQPGGAFFAIEGEETDGHLFIDKAVQQGARLVVCEKLPEGAVSRTPQADFIAVNNSRAALAEAAALYHGDPADELQMIGVTGTNGKTTTARLIYHLLQGLDVTCGLIGTIDVRVGERVHDASLTTPDPLKLQALLREMADAGCTACAMEVSSHALQQDRVRAIDYSAGVFTNLSQDHLDYHSSMESYRNAKKRLFDSLASNAVAIVNGDDDASEVMVQDCQADVVTYGLEPKWDVNVVIEQNALSGLVLKLDGLKCHFSLVGRFNAYNLAATYAVGRALGYGKEEVVEVLQEAPPVAGRFEQLQSPDGVIAIVDYAHTPDALENVLKTIREANTAGGRVWCVFGCGGDRDRSKRPTMGRIVEELADELVVTSDNPRTEDPERILDDIREGLHHPEKARWIVERSAAIELAVTEASAKDVVLVAGKGHETYQIRGTEKRHFDDREEVRSAFAKRKKKT